MAGRVCSKQGCRREAIAIVTYDYESSTCVLGPLRPHSVGQGFELCGRHAADFRPPRGWQVIRHRDFAPETADRSDAVGRSGGSGPRGTSEPSDVPRMRAEPDLQGRPEPHKIRETTERP